jgi:thiamine biosynthesis lipoprotein
MGTRFELLLRGSDAIALRSAGEAAIEEIVRWHNLLSAFDRASVVSRLNREAAEHAVAVPPEVASLLRWCREVSEATAGAFNPAVGDLMRRAGFRGEPRATGETVPPFHATVQLEGNRVRFVAKVALDFGAVGKGWALDRATELLREVGVSCALLHGGTSSIASIGGPWGIDVGGTPVVLSDESLGFSASSGRTVTDGSGAVHGHILDPRTGGSAGARCAAVVGPGAAVCDAWSTALAVDPALDASPAWPIGYRARIEDVDRLVPTCSVQPACPTLSSQGSPL